jgi:hypothetical protein
MTTPGTSSSWWLERTLLHGEQRGKQSHVYALPNHALEPTAASGLRRLAGPSALRASAAAQRERSASRMATLIRTQSPPVLCSSPRQPLVPDSLSRRRRLSVCHRRPAHVGARATETPCSIDACSSRRRAFNRHRRFGEAVRPVSSQAPLVKVMPGSVLSSTLAHTRFAALPSVRAVPAATPNHAFDRTAASVPLAVPSSLRSSAAGQRGRSASQERCSCSSVTVASSRARPLRQRSQLRSAFRCRNALAFVRPSRVRSPTHRKCLLLCEG